MRHDSLVGIDELGSGAAKRRIPEDRVVAEAVDAARFFCNAALNGGFGLEQDLIRVRDRERGDEPRIARVRSEAAENFFETLRVRRRRAPA